MDARGMLMMIMFVVGMLGYFIILPTYNALNNLTAQLETIHDKYQQATYNGQ